MRERQQKMSKAHDVVLGDELEGSGDVPLVDERLSEGVMADLRFVLGRSRVQLANARQRLLDLLARLELGSGSCKDGEGQEQRGEERGGSHREWKDRLGRTRC